MFSPTIAHAEHFAAMLRRYDFKAEALSSEMPPRDRDIVMARFRAGELQMVTTVTCSMRGSTYPTLTHRFYARDT